MITTVISRPSTSKIGRTHRQRFRPGSKKTGCCAMEECSHRTTSLPVYCAVLSRQRAAYFIAAILGAGLRLWFVSGHSLVQGDSLIYADIARNWLHRGVYGITDGATITPVLIRLPGYPAFLAAVFAVFGDNSFIAVMVLQVLVDLFTCWAVADLAAQLLSDNQRERVRLWAFVLAALCPFTANYVALPLTET